jgi:hypothetical protein
VYSCEASHLRSGLTSPQPATQLLACATLFWFAMLLKTIIARAVSSHFMKEAHFAKMAVALENVRSQLLSFYMHVVVGGGGYHTYLQILHFLAHRLCW